MSRVIEKTAYQFEELSNEAKEKAREWWRSNSDFNFDTECILDDAIQIAETLGIDIDTSRGGKEPAIYYSGFWSQGDGACFEGTWRYAKGIRKKIREHAPKNIELHRIADAMFEIQSKYFYQVYATVTHIGRYNHSMSNFISVENQRPPYVMRDEEVVIQLLRDFMDWIYDTLKKAYEYRMQDAQVDEALVEGEYEFWEDGSRAHT